MPDLFVVIENMAILPVIADFSGTNEGTKLQHEHLLIYIYIAIKFNNCIICLSPLKYSLYIKNAVEILLQILME